MRVAFLIERRNFYRLLGPVVDRALERGWETECWHDWGQPRRGPKGSEFPATMPDFRHGRPAVRTFVGAAGVAALCAAARPDAVIALRQPAAGETPAPTRWFGLQYTLDVAELIDGSGRTGCDGIGLHSEYWRDRVPDCVRMRAYNRARAARRAPDAVDAGAVAETLRRVGTVVGIPEMDQWHAIDPGEVRRRLGIERDRPVVLYCPFPFSTNPRTFWVRHVYGARRALWRRLAVGLAGRREYQAHVARRLCDASVVDAVRAFCDRNDALLIVKARAKDPVPRYLAARADHVFYDVEYYPATILELLRISALCLHFFSTVAYEAAYAGVPSVCIAPGVDELGFPPPWREWFLNLDARGSFNFRGAVYPLGLEEFVAGFAGRRLGDFSLDPVARAQYVEKFIGFDDGKSADRVLDAVLSPIERGGQG